MFFGKIHILKRRDWLLCGRLKRKTHCAVFPKHIVKIHHRKLWCMKCLERSRVHKKKTEVVNMRTYGVRDVVLIDRTTIFGNRNRIKKGCTRKQSIEKFRVYFEHRIKTDKVFRRKVRKLAGRKIGCWCKPLPCHGDIYVEYLEGE